ncbi:MAG: complex I 51 kDa subunit family protein [Bacteroidales bacterium]
MLLNNIQISLKNVGKIDPLSIDDYELNGGFLAIQKALKQKPSELIEQIEKSGLRGMGGAGYPTGSKLRSASSTCHECKERYIVCNADEGEPGTFKDRHIMENNPFLLIEGMMIAGYAIGAKQGYIYIRGEYYQSISNIKNAIQQAYKKGYLGQNIFNTGFSFDIDVFLGAGSYLCGEAITLIESLEGKRGYPRVKPPYLAEKGLWGKPTVVNNVETLSHLPFIILEGYETYQSIGTEESKGTKIFCVSGNVNKTGVFEQPMGITLRELIFDICGGMKNGYEFKGALLGGAAGTFVDATMLDIPLAYETLKKHGATLGTGTVIVLDNKTNLKALLQSILNFFKHESCGKCVPCRIGTTLISKKINEEPLNEENLKWILAQTEYMAKTSLCPLGQSPILPVKSIIKYFKSELIETY